MKRSRALMLISVALCALVWTTIDTGGGTLTGGTYSLVSTIGQPEPGPGAGGGGYSFTGGVVNAGRSGGTTPSGRRVFLPLIIRWRRLWIA